MLVTTVILMTKKEARKYVFAQNKNISTEQLNLWKKDVFEKLEKNNYFINAQTVGIYFPIFKELNLTELIEKYPNKTFYFPKTVLRTLEFKTVSHLNELVNGPYGLKEPPTNFKTKKKIDVYLVPCVATSGNYRIGHGAGFYDHYFKDHKGYKIGIVNPMFKDLSVSVDKHDIPMDEIL